MAQSKQIISEAAKNITTDISGRLPARSGAVRLRDLISCEIPDFVISGIERKVEKNLVDTFVMPETDWAVTDRPEVDKAWENLLFELRKEYSFSVQKASDIIGEVVVEILNLLVSPRKCIPEKLFCSDSKVDRDTLNERARSIFVHKHLAMAPVRYLYRKNLDTLTLEQCRRVVSQVDEKLIIRYETRNWTDLLDTIFQLTGDSADPRLLSLYFQDKMRPQAARRFDSLQDEVTRNVLEEILREVDMSQSSESSGGQFIGENSSAGEDSGEESESDDSGSSVSERFYLEMKESDGEKRDEDRSETWKYAGEEDRSEEGIHFNIDHYPADGLIFESQSVEDDEKGGDDGNIENEDEIPLHRKFITDDSGVEKSETEEPEIERVASPDTEFTGSYDTSEKTDEKPEAGDSLNDSDLSTGHTTDSNGVRISIRSAADETAEMSVSFDSAMQEAPDMRDSGEAAEEEFSLKLGVRDSGGRSVVQDGQETGVWYRGFEQENEGEEDDVHNPENPENFEDGEQQENYIWQNFISSETDEEPEDDRNRISKTLAGEFLEEETDCSGDLIEWLGNDEDRIVKEIFGDSQKAFKEAMAALAAQEDWNSGAAYIKKDIFSRYRVDMYDEVAVDFTDKMHSWFIENKSA